MYVDISQPIDTLEYFDIHTNSFVKLGPVLDTYNTADYKEYTSIGGNTTRVNQQPEMLMTIGVDININTNMFNDKVEHTFRYNDILLKAFVTGWTIQQSLYQHGRLEIQMTMISESKIEKVEQPTLQACVSCGRFDVDLL